MTPPILKTEVSYGDTGEEYVPDHGNMAILELAVEGSVDLGGCYLALERPDIAIVGAFLLVAPLVGGHGERKKSQPV